MHLRRAVHFVNAINNWREHLTNSVNVPVHQQVTLKDSKQNLAVYPSEVGSGIAQVIPVVAATLNSDFKIVSIEQPELHVHPALQTHLGDLFGHAAVEGNRLLIIETHSEHLMLRLMRRIREFHHGELLKGKPELTRDHLSVIYVESGGKVKSLRVTRDGDFMDEWPEGFFEERMKELF
jgi:predicted ATPase